MVAIKHIAVAAAAIAGINAQEMKDSICDKYTKALLKNNTAENQYTLLTLLVKTAALGNFTGPGSPNPSLPGSMVAVPGILAKEGGLMKYFTGEIASSNVDGKPAGVNWLDVNATRLVSEPTFIGDEGTMSQRLLSHLFSYFGAALGCSTYSKEGFPAYMGDKSMTNVHKYMALDAAQNNYFIMQVGLAAKSFGAVDDDITAVAKLLNTTFNERCAPEATVIPEQGPALQAICLASSCPEAMNPQCNAYEGAYTAESQIMSATSTASMPAMSSGAMSSGAMSSGAEASATPSASMSMSGSAASASPTTGAAVANGVSGGLAALAGVAAFLL